MSGAPSTLIGYIQTEKLSKGMPERAYEKYAWVIFFALGVLGLVFSSVSFSPELFLPRLGFAVLLIAVSMNSYRRGEKWAWYAMWILVVIPALSLFFAETSFPPFDVPAVIVALLGLFLPYRKFFPKKRPIAP